TGLASHRRLVCAPADGLLLYRRPPPKRRSEAMFYFPLIARGAAWAKAQRCASRPRLGRPCRNCHPSRARLFLESLEGRDLFSLGGPQPLIPAPQPINISNSGQ